MSRGLSASSVLLFALAVEGVGGAGGTETAKREFSIVETDLTLRREATARRFVSAHGRRGMVVGYAAQTLEGWIYPFRIFHDYRVEFRAESNAKAIPGAALIREVIVNPESVTRVYSGQNFTVRETIFVPLDAAGFEILYEVENRTPLHIALSFRPDLDLMWPGGIGGQNYGWDENRHAFVLADSSGRYSALIGSPFAGNHSEGAEYTLPWNADRRLALELEVPAPSRRDEPRRYFPLIVSLSIPGHYEASKTYEELLTKTADLYAEAVDHYRKLLASHFQVETPDRAVNLAYSWARIALDQAYVCNPYLGCGLVAGYGPSRDTRRPQYAWFFGGDALNNTFALEAAGDHELARDAMRFIQRYQKKDTGEIFHELSQSAGLIEWFKDYPYAYRHTDASAMYLVAFRNLYRSSGDLDFLRESWDSLRRAYQYLVSRLDPADGLVTVPPGGWGGDETAGEQVVKDIYLESVWVAGAEAMAGLAHVVGDAPLAGDAQGRAEKARESIAAKLWNPKQGFFFYGFNGRGELLTQQLGQPNWGIWLGVFDPGKAERALDRMAHANWESDWGLRSIPSDDPLYIGDSYGHGSVWPLGTGVQSLADYRYHRRLQAEPLWHSFVEQTFLNSLGHVPEVFSGDFYRELDVCVPEQIWSSGMVITSFVRGLLGLEPYAPSARLVWAPHLPPNWAGVKLRNLTLGRSTLNLEMEQLDSEIRLRVENPFAPVEMEFSPEIPLGSKNLAATLNGRPVEVGLREYAQDAHAEINLKADQQEELVIHFDPGVRAWLPTAPLPIGSVNGGLKVLSTRLEGRTYRAEVEGVPQACSAYALSSPWQVKRVTGGKVSAHEGNVWHFVLSPHPDSCGADARASDSRDGYKTWDFEVEFAP